LKFNLFPKFVIPACFWRWLDWARHTELAELESRQLGLGRIETFGSE